MRHCVREDIGVHHHNQSDNRCQRDGVPENETEYLAFITDLVGSSRCHADGLRVHHLAHHAACTVGGAHQDRIETELLRSDSLQTTEQCVRGRIATCQRYSQPAEKRSKNWKEPTATSEG